MSDFKKGVILFLLATAALAAQTSTQPPCPKGYTCFPAPMVSSGPLRDLPISNPIGNLSAPIVSAPQVVAIQNPEPGAPNCPESFYAIGAALNRASTPNIAAQYAIAVPLTRCGTSFQLYSYTQNTVTPIGSGNNLTFQNTASSGFAYPLKQFGPVDVLVMANLGLSTNGPSSNIAGAYGLLLGFPICKHCDWKGLIEAEKVDSRNLYILGIGRTFKK